MNILCPAGLVGWVFVYYKSFECFFQFRQVLTGRSISLIFLAYFVMVKAVLYDYSGY